MSVLSEMASAASEEVVSEYRAALVELNSSKPQITFLTMLADESKDHGMAIVTCIADYATSCPAIQKLPLLYLVDSIIKNVRGDYVKQFQQKIHHMFANIFEKVDERTRRKMYELRQTWNDIFRKSTLYSLDMKVVALDPAWPVIAPTPLSGGGTANPGSTRTKSSTIFVNPSILKSRGIGGAGSEVGVLSKELELLELKKQKLALEKEKVLAQQGKGGSAGSSGVDIAEEGGHKSSRGSSSSRKASSSSSSRPHSASSNYTPSSVGNHADLLKGKGYKIKKKPPGHSEPLPSPAVSSTSLSVEPVAASAPPPVPAALQRPPPALVPPMSQPEKASGSTTIHVDPRRAVSHLPPSHLRKPSAVIATTSTSSVPSIIPTSQSVEASSAAAKTTFNYVPSAHRDPRAQVSAPGGGGSSSRDPRGMAVNSSSSAALVTASSMTTSSVTAPAGPPSAASSRDPRIKTDPRLKPPHPSSQQLLHQQHGKSASSRDGKNSSSANGASGHKGRPASTKSRSKERSSSGQEKDQLFKPDIVNKGTSKIKIDLNLDAKKLKGSSSRDPRAKSRDPRIAGKESKAEVASVTDTMTSRVTPESTVLDNSAKGKRSRSVSSDGEKEANRSSRDKSADRREEIKRELKKVDKKETRREERHGSHSRTRKDRSSSPKQHIRSREKSSREPEKKKSRSSSPTSEVSTEMSVTAPTAPTTTSAPIKSDAPPAPPVTRPTVSSSNTSSESIVSDLTVTLAAVMTTSSSTTAKSTTSPNTTPNYDVSPPPGLSAAAQDSFRSVDRDRSRKRNIRKRTSLSPESGAVAAAAGDAFGQQDEAVPPQEGKGRKEEGSESDESDHYEANKPSPAVYSDKKGAPITAAGDVDLRLFNSPPKRLGPADTSKMSRVDELFGSEDVDLRTLGSSALAAVAGPLDSVTNDAAAAASSLPAAFQPTTAGAPPAPVVGDQDLRSGLAGAQPTRIQEPPVCAASAAGSSVAVLMEKGDQPSTAHPQNWDHFRQKNPHFKEYQRQCSTPSLPDMQSPQPAADPARVRARIRRRLQDEEDELSDVSGGSSPGHDGKKCENLQVIACQAEEQLKTGQISLTEYNSTLQKVLGLYEMEKVERARERARSCSLERRLPPTEGHGHGPLQPPPHLRRGEVGPMRPAGRGVDPLTPPPLPPPHIRMHRDVRGRGRGPLPPPPRPMFGAGFGLDRDEFVGGPRGGRGVGDVDGPRGGRGVGDVDGPRGGRGVGDVENRFRGGYPDEWTGEPDLPFVSPELLRDVDRFGETRTVDIDRRPREIRTYGGTAIVLLDQFEPRTLSFEDHSCDIVFEEGKFVIHMHTTDDYREFKIGGESHRIRLGVPTQELFLDGFGFQCFFGGTPIGLHLAGASRTIRLDGESPNVVIGEKMNTDYLLGKVSLVINANTKRMMSLFLDARPQRITINGKPLVLKFIDKFRAVNINSVSFPIEFGGLPLAISVKQRRKYLSFSSLPPDIIPGKTSVIGMDSDTLIPIYPENRAHLSPLAKPLPPSSEVLPLPVAIHPPPIPPKLPLFPPPPRMPAVNIDHPPTATSTPKTTSLVAPPPFPKLIPTGAAAVVPSPSLPSVVTPKTEPGAITDTKPSVTETKPSISALSSVVAEDDDDICIVPGSYITKQGSNDLPLPRSDAFKIPKRSSSPGVSTTSSSSSSSSKNMDVSSLLQSLIKNGIIGAPATTGAATADSSANEGLTAGPKGDRPIIKVKKIDELKSTDKVVLDENDQDWVEQDEENETEYKFYDIAKMDFLFKSQQLRRRSGALVSALYRGMQCSSCGMRYPPEQTVQYSHHLDWHFRQNKREQESTKKASARKFYIPIDDWMQYEEIEDVEERVPSMFENEGGLSGELGRTSTEGGDDGAECSVPVNSDEPGLGVCSVCHDTFTQFFQHDTDEWHYRDAVARDGANYHPSCHQDLVRQKEKEEEKKKLELEEEEKAKEQKEQDQMETEPKEGMVELSQEEKKNVEVKDNGLVEVMEGVVNAASANDQTTAHKIDVDQSTVSETTLANDSVSPAAQAVTAADKVPVATDEIPAVAATDEVPAVATDAVSAAAAAAATDAVPAAAAAAAAAMDAVPAAATMDAVPAAAATDAVPAAAAAMDAVPAAVATDAVSAAAAATDAVPVAADSVPVDAVAADAVPVDADAVAADAVPFAADAVPVAENIVAPAAAASVPSVSTAADTVAAQEFPSGLDTPEAAASPAEPEKKKKKKKKKKKPVIEPIMPAIRIKEEPQDADDISFFTPPGQGPNLMAVAVKQERPDEPDIQEEAVAADEGIEEMDQSAAEDDLSMMLDTAGELSTSAAQTNLMISTIDGNVEQVAAPDTQPDTATAPKIRLSGALGNLIAKTVAKAKEGEADNDVLQVADPSPISVIGGQVAGDSVKDKPDTLEKGRTDEQQKEATDNTDVPTQQQNGLAEDEGVEGVLSDDDDIIEWDEFVPPPFVPNLDAHPKFDGAQLDDLGVQRAGIELSGVCSIM